MRSDLMMRRILVIKGSVMVLWRMLTPAVFDYKASCDSSGHTIYEHISDEKQPSHSQLLLSSSSTVCIQGEEGEKEEEVVSSPSSGEKNGVTSATGTAAGIHIIFYDLTF